jgi:hypothetical protein
VSEITLTIMPCKICKGAINIDDQTTWFMAMQEDGYTPKCLVHYSCYEAAQEVLPIPEDRSAELFALQAKVNDLEMALIDMKKSAENSIDVSSLVSYLNELIESQTVNAHRAPKGSDYSRIAAFRTNDATDILERIKSLMPKNGPHIEHE